MRTVTLGLASRKKVNERVGRAFEGKYQGDFISFASPETLFNVLAGRRWELLEIMTGQGPIAIREAARRQGREIGRAHV